MKARKPKAPKAPKPPKPLNPCFGATLTKQPKPATHWAMSLPFVPSTKGLTAYANHFKHVKQLDRRVSPPKVTFDDKALVRLRAKYPLDPLYQLLPELRGVEKLKGTYVDGIVPFINAQGRVCGEFNHAPITLRLAMKNPSLLNLPRIDPEDESAAANAIRALYIAAPGHILMARDYSGIESRIVGYLANDPLMVRLTALDIHSFFVSHVINQPADPTWDDATIMAHLGPIKKAHKSTRQAAKKIGHACLTAEHEVLTPTGWQSIADITLQDTVAQWAESGEITFVYPTARHQYAYAGDMVHVLGHSISAIMTPNHRVPIRFTGRPVHVCEASALTSRRKLECVPVAGHLRTGDDVPVAELQLVVALQADGSLNERELRLKLRRPRKIARLRGILAALQMAHRHTMLADGVTQVFTIKRAELDQVLRWFEPDSIWPAERKTCEKRFSLPALLTLSPDLRAMILAEVVEWDGSRGAGNRRVYVSTCKHNTDVMQTLAHLNGHQALLRSGGEGALTGRVQPIQILSFNKRANAYPACADTTTVPFAGQVYCLTVPTGFFLIRHRDRISVTGNSNYLASPHKAFLEEPQLFGTKKETERLMEVYHGIFPSVRRWHTQTCNKVDAQGYVTAPDGFRLHYADVYTFTFSKGAGVWEQQFGPQAKEAVAGVPQHMGAAFLMRAAVTLCERYPEFTAMLRLLIHDEILWEAPEDEADLWDQRVAAVMEEPMPCMPLPPEWGMGDYLTVGTEGKRGKCWGNMR